MDSGKYCSTPADVPEGEHWAILEGTSINIPGDKRSRTNPGHGYPETTENHITYRAFTDKAAFEAELRRMYEQRRTTAPIFKAIHVLGVLQAEVTISFKERK